MIQKILGVLAAVLLVVAGTLAFQLHGARDTVISLASERDSAKQELSNTRVALKTSEAQNAILEASFKSLDTRLGQMEKNQQHNNQQLALALSQLNDIQNTEGDDPNAITCLDTRVPAQLDQWLYDTPAGANGGH